jgi:hypothetical protein
VAEYKKSKDWGRTALSQAMEEFCLILEDRGRVASEIFHSVSDSALKPAAWGRVLAFLLAVGCAEKIKEWASTLPGPLHALGAGVLVRSLGTMHDYSHSKEFWDALKKEDMDPDASHQAFVEIMEEMRRSFEKKLEEGGDGSADLA